MSAATALSDGSSVMVYTSTSDGSQVSASTGPVARSADWIDQALARVRLAEEVETCPFCKSHITATRVVLEDLLAVAEMGDDLRKHERLRELSLRIGELGDRIGGFSVLARVIHRVKGLR
jgi:hypothetical protein